MNIRPVGDSALLVELPDFQAAHALRHALCESPSPGILEMVPGFNTLLIGIDPLKLDAEQLVADIQALSTGFLFTPRSAEHEIGVHYDGIDLETVAQETGFMVAEIIRRHSEPVYTVAFIGFAPGFPYLLGLDPSLRVARLGTPRIQVPAGAVAIADQFTGIYPQPTPGGWRLLGATDTRLFDATRAPPSRLAPGDKVRFRVLR
ncbi:MAG TPA: allophanate hydrolase subunit 1 [Gammaproteobacteria bacterium]|nr:allophanate hydrolase subunit 1 [Gammaproteobacteria bacterium]